MSPTSTRRPPAFGAFAVDPVFDWSVPNVSANASAVAIPYLLNMNNSNSTNGTIRFAKYYLAQNGRHCESHGAEAIGSEVECKLAAASHGFVFATGQQFELIASDQSVNRDRVPGGCFYRRCGYDHGHVCGVYFNVNLTQNSDPNAHAISPSFGGFCGDLTGPPSSRPAFTGAAAGRWTLPPGFRHTNSYYDGAFTRCGVPAS